MNRIAFLNTAAIGDTVLFFGVIKDIKAKYPGCELVFFSGQQNHSIVKMTNEIDKVIILPVKNPVQSIRMVRGEGSFDVFVDFMAWPRINSLIAFFAEADIKIGFKTKDQYRHYVFDIATEHSDKIHEVDNYRSLLRPLGIVSRSMPRIDIEGRVVENLIVLHMFPSGYMAIRKCWPDEYWREIALHFLSKGFDVCITGGPSDRVKGEQFANQFASYSNFHNYAGHLSLSETIKVLSKAHLVISVNTGIMHVAAALNANLVALNGPTDVKRWGPLNENSISIQSPHPNAPCLNLGFEYSCKNENCNCMSLITVAKVIESASRF